MSPRILLISEMFPPKVGGSGRWFREIYPRLERFDVGIAAGSDPAEDTVAEVPGVELRRFELTFPTRFLRPASFGHYRRARRELEAWIDEERPTQLHAGRAVPEGLLALSLHRRTGIPYAVYAHGEEVNPSNPEPRPHWHRRAIYGSRELGFMVGRVLSGADRIIANSRNTCSILTDRWGLNEDKVALLHPGVDTQRFRPAERDAAVRRELGWGDRPVVLTVGRLQQRKGHDTLLRALPGILERTPETLYAVVGDGEERAALESLRDTLGLANAVRFHGEIDDDALLACYQQADLFVLPNRTIGGDVEGFGMVLLEAQSCGTPVVAGRSGGTAETMDEGVTGELADCDGPKALEQLVSQLLNDQSRLAAMATAARPWVLERFDWSSLARHADALFSSPVGAS